MPDDKSLKLGPDAPIHSFPDLLELTWDLIDLQRTRVAKAAEVESAEGSLKRDLSAEIKRLNGLMITAETLMSSPHSKVEPQAPEGPSILEKIFMDLQKPKRKKRQRLR